MNQTNWYNCYDDGWKGIIVPEAFSHPAKMACGLTKRIFKHALSEGWLMKGDVVVDPFGGIGSTGIIGAYEGIHVLCYELEMKFCKLAMENFNLHGPKLKKLGLPRPQIIQGDSRKLSEVIAGADCLIGSPPYAESDTSMSHGSGTSRTDPSSKNYRPYAVRNLEKHESKRDYGQSPGQLGAMKPGSVAATISSPPFSVPGSQIPNVGGSRPVRSRQNEVPERPDNYGTTPGNLGNLKPGEVDGIISSPPFMETQGTGSGELEARKGRTDTTGEYGTSKGQLGNDKGETFWAAAKQIVSECHKILKPGGYAIWVVKAFVRKGRRVDFPGDWRRLCESQGFKTVCVHHAMLVKETRQDGLFEEIVETKARKSFFRGLAETKAAWKKYWNTVPSEHEKAVWRFKASMWSRYWIDPPELYSPLAMCFVASGEKVRDWNEHVRIDYEVVLCTQKTSPN